MASKLALYKMACMHLGERKLASLSETGDVLSTLDVWYDHAVSACLQRGFWNFAMRAITITASGVITPGFGYAYAFEKPSDWVRTFEMSTAETFCPALNDFRDEALVWYANTTPLYARYVSNDASYGGNLTSWPENFTFFVSLHLAYLSWKIANDKELREALKTEAVRACGVALSTDATDEPPRSPPHGSWVTSRRTINSNPRSQTLGY